jgi:hypothetical protein
MTEGHTKVLAKLSVYSFFIKSFNLQHLLLTRTRTGTRTLTHIHTLIFIYNVRRITIQWDSGRERQYRNDENASLFDIRIIREVGTDLRISVTQNG